MTPGSPRRFAPRDDDSVNARATSYFELRRRSERMNDMRWAARLLFLPLLILSFAPFAYSEERPSIFLEDLTWTELRDDKGF